MIVENYIDPVDCVLLESALQASAAQSLVGVGGPPIEAPTPSALASSVPDEQPASSGQLESSEKGVEAPAYQLIPSPSHLPEYYIPM